MESDPDHVEHIWIVTGPAGCGKTTVAQHLAETLGLPYVEGDDFHPVANKQKMAEGHPLTDADRWDWLITLREEAIKQLRTSNSVIVTCSALKHKYRDVIRVANYEHPSVQVHFIYLKVDEQTLQQRVKERVGHYMKEGMVHSQMAALEEPEEDQEWDVLRVDVRNDKEEVQRNALALVRQKLKEYEHANGVAN
ncbi:shikimate kinase [Exophiala aquamarina CBS 119918]|uniref:Gluconokinase n=1 Tax=Exophiala aquamarina CBS 119918 TaxID=1182545 RepID=A0A072PB93_9EURO|nr:shikimate kinase [Exophiala aquamarina CBS 119918]KEF52810.1 shikimate kinase [Exophiala aquamarina CBS 119918]